MDQQQGRLVNFRLLYLIAQLIGVILIILIISWIGIHLQGFGWDYDVPAVLFNWHPILMTIGMVFLYGNCEYFQVSPLMENHLTSIFIQQQFWFTEASVTEGRRTWKSRMLPFMDLHSSLQSTVLWLLSIRTTTRYQRFPTCIPCILGLDFLPLSSFLVNTWLDFCATCSQCSKSHSEFSTCRFTFSSDFLALCWRLSHAWWDFPKKLSLQCPVARMANFPVKHSWSIPSAS